MRRLRKVLLAALLCIPLLAAGADKLTSAMLHGQWRVTAAEISPPGADTSGTWSVIRDLDLRADGRYVMHWGWRITPEPGARSARSEGHWGWSAPGTVKLCGQNKIACNDIAACVMGTAQCLKVVAFGSDSMRLRMTGPGGAVMEYRLERRSGSSDFKGAGNDSSVQYVHDFSPEALREFKAASGIAITGLRPEYRTTLAVLRGALDPHAREYAESYLAWYYHSFRYREKGATPPPVILSEPGSETHRRQVASVRYMIEVAEWLRGKQGNEIYATYGGVVADVGKKVVAERETGSESDFQTRLTEAVDRRYRVRVDPAVVRAGIAGRRSMCIEDFDPVEGMCRVWLPGI
jgi:hypothetical protein